MNQPLLSEGTVGDSNMFRSTVSSVDQVVQQLNGQLNRYTEHLRNQAIRAGVVAAGEPMKEMMTSILRSTLKAGKEPPTRRISGTNITIARPHLRDSVTNKVWRIPGGNGYINYIGPISIQVPHAIWFERGTAMRQTRGGRNRGRIPPFLILTRSYQASINQAISAFETTVKNKLASFTP